MKTSIIEFFCLYKGKVQRNSAIVTIVVKPAKGVPSIHFKKPLYDITYDQLMNLGSSIEEFFLTVHSEPGEEMGLAVSENPLSVVKKEGGLNGFRSMVENMAKRLDKSGKFSAEEKKDVSTAFGLIEKLLGPKK